LASSRFSAPAPTCLLPFWELSAHRLGFSRSPQRMHLGISTSRKCLLDCGWAGPRADLAIGRGFNFCLCFRNEGRRVGAFSTMDCRRAWIFRDKHGGVWSVAHPGRLAIPRGFWTVIPLRDEKGGGFTCAQ
jgi:hypothetical protein